MLGSLVVLWLGSEPELAERRADIAVWASAHQLHAEPLLPTAPSYDAALAAQIEALLEEARAATAAEATPSALERAEALLLEHPELPQAAWLLAERYAIEAHVPRPPEATDERRRELGERARGLEGARAAPVAAAPLPAAEFMAPAMALAPSGARPYDRLFIDAVAVPNGAPSARTSVAFAGEAAPHASAPAAGRHHVRLTRAGLPVWSGWVELEAGRAWSLIDPSPVCSALDLADVSAGHGTPEPAPGVRCKRWAVARPSPSGGTDIAECSGSRCGSWQSAMATPLVAVIPRAPSAAEGEPGTWPSWATWGLVGAGAIAATGIVLWQVGAFDRGEPATEFVFTGPNAPGYRF